MSRQCSACPKGGRTGMVTGVTFLNRAKGGEPGAGTETLPIFNCEDKPRLVQVSSMESVSSTAGLETSRGVCSDRYASMPSSMGEVARRTR